MDACAKISKIEGYELLRYMAAPDDSEDAIDPEPPAGSCCRSSPFGLRDPNDRPRAFPGDQPHCSRAQRRDGRALGRVVGTNRDGILGVSAEVPRVS